VVAVRVGPDAVVEGVVRGEGDVVENAPVVGRHDVAAGLVLVRAGGPGQKFDVVRGQERAPLGKEDRLGGRVEDAHRVVGRSHRVAPDVVAQGVALADGAGRQLLAGRDGVRAGDGDLG
jgi:hypothetical protein